MTNLERETKIIGKHEFWFFSPNRLHGIAFSYKFVDSFDDANAWFEQLRTGSAAK